MLLVHEEYQSSFDFAMKCAVESEGIKTPEDIEAGADEYVSLRRDWNDEVAAFAKFGSDLDPATQQQLNRGVRLYELFKQGQYEPYEPEEVVAALFIGVKGYCDRIDVEHIQDFEGAFLAHMKSANSKILADIVSDGYKLSEATEKSLHDIAEAFTSGYSP